MGDRYGETESRVLQRECAAVSVPWGRPETLEEGSYALITQRLGGSITVMSGGNLYRIDERNADALGLEPQLAAAPPAPAEGEQTAESIERREQAAAQRKAGALGMQTDGRPSKKQRRQMHDFNDRQDGGLRHPWADQDE